MNARLLILAVLTAVILALFMSASAPGQEPQEAYFRMTLGGDCSADRATGDLYHPVDPYCIVAQGSAGPVTWNMAPNGPGAGARDEGLNPQLDERSGAPVDRSAPAQTNIQAKKQDKDDSNPAVGEQTDNQSGANAGTVANVEEPTSIPSVQPGEQGDAGPSVKIDEPAAPQGKDSPKDQPEEQSKTRVDKHLDDRNDDPVKKQAKDQAPAGKECKKAGRDNVNSQGKHDCSADNPDKHSGQERTTDHNPSDQAHRDDPGKDKEKKD